MKTKQGLFDSLKGLPPNLWILAAATLINRAGMMALPFLTIYLTNELDISASEAGLVFMFYGIGALVTTPFIGKLIDKVSPFFIMKLSLIVSGLMLFIYPLINDYYEILVVTFIWSAISEAFRPANLVVISTEASKEQMRNAFALNRLAINVGMTIGPFIGGILATISLELLFYVNGIASISSGAFLYFSKWKTHEKTTESTIDINTKPAKPMYKDLSFLYFIAALIPVTIVFFQFGSTLPLYIVNHLGFTEFIVGLAFAINTILVITIEVPLTDKLSYWSYRRGLFISAVLCAVGFGSLALSVNFLTLVIPIIFFTFGEMLLFPLSATYVAEIAPKGKQGTYMGMYQTTFNIALTFGPWLGTLLIDNYGFTTLWIASFVVAGISAFMMLFIRKTTTN